MRRHFPGRYILRFSNSSNTHSISLVHGSPPTVPANGSTHSHVTRRSCRRLKPVHAPRMATEYACIHRSGADCAVLCKSYQCWPVSSVYGRGSSGSALILGLNP